MDLKVRNLTAGYGHGAPPILHNLSFHIPEGHRVSILGANGCGKTTLLRTLLGLLPHEGEILLNGQSINTMKRRDIASCVALMTQLSETYFSYTVYETVMQGRFLHMKGLFNLPSKQDREVVEEVLQATGLRESADRTITELSGGQRQRVFLARTLAQETPLLFLDEPTNHLDLKYQAELMDYLETWAKGSSQDSAGIRHPHTLVSVFHDINLALRLSDDVLVLKNGELLAFGPIKSTLTKELLEDAFSFDVASYMRRQLQFWQ